MAERGLIPPVIKHGNLLTERDITNAGDSAEAIIALLHLGINNRLLFFQALF